MYIILDLEWDSTYLVSQKRFVNQILQIGAVKLDSDLSIVDTFEETVCSAVSKKVSSRFTKLTGITSDDMKKGIPLQTAVQRYNDWIGDGTVTMTWSNSDLYAVLENQKYLLKGLKFKIEKYLDLQSFIQNEMKKLGFEVKSQIALSAAAEALGVKTEGFDMHTAKDDSLVCAELLKKYYNKKSFERLVKDTSQNYFFERLEYRPVYIRDINDERIDRSYLECRCDKCGSVAELKNKWKNINRCHFANFHCQNCGRDLTARVSFRVDFDGITVKKKVYETKKKVKKTEGEKTDDLQSVSEKV